MVHVQPNRLRSRTMRLHDQQRSQQITSHVSAGDVDVSVTPSQATAEPEGFVEVDFLVNLDPDFQFRLGWFTDDQCDAGLFQVGFDLRYEISVDDNLRTTGTDCMTDHEQSYSTTLQMPSTEGTYPVTVEIIGNETDRVLATAETVIEVESGAPIDEPPNGDDGDIWTQIQRFIADLPTSYVLGGLGIVAVAALL